MKTAGWWANITTPSRNRPLTIIAVGGGPLRSRMPAASGVARSRWRAKISVTTEALITTASAAFQPKWLSMNVESQPHFAATISTGGAANEVSVPPIDTLTKSTPSVAYFTRSGSSTLNTRSRRVSAASVMAAGSVSAEPISGSTDSARKYTAIDRGSGVTRASAFTSTSASFRMGLLPATTMIAKTKSGSVKLRLSM